MGLKRAELIKKNPVNRGVDFEYVDGVMRKILAAHFPDCTHIKRIHRIKHKRRIGKHNSTFIYEYVFTGTTAQGTAFRKELVYSSHSDDSRKIAFDFLRGLIGAGFNEGNYRVIVPLEYVPEIKTVIYEAVPGKTMLEYVRPAHTAESAKIFLHHTAAWLKKFHTFPLPPKLKASLSHFNIMSFYWTADEILDYARKHDAFKQAEKLELFLRTLSEVYKKTVPLFTPGVTYGDPHPENTVFDSAQPSGLTMIDFTDVASGDQMRDLAIFIQQLKFMGKDMFTDAQLNMLSEYFLQQYFGRPIAELSDEIIMRLNLYQAWNALRSFIYFLYQKNKRRESYGLLEDAWRYLGHARDKKRILTISYT